MDKKIDVINEIGVVKARFNSIKTKENKGKSATWLEFKSESGAVCSARLGSPMKAWDHYLLAEIITALKGSEVKGNAFKGQTDNALIAACEKYVGTSLVVYPRPVEWDGNVFWTVKHADNIKYYKQEGKIDVHVSTIQDAFDTNNKQDIPF